MKTFNAALTLSLTILSAAQAAPASAHELFYRTTTHPESGCLVISACETKDDGITSCMPRGRADGYTPAEIQSREDAVVRAANDQHRDARAYGDTAGMIGGALGAAGGTAHVQKILSDGAPIYRRPLRILAGGMPGALLGVVGGEFFGTIMGKIADLRRVALDQDDTTQRAIEGRRSREGNHSYRGNLYILVDDLDAYLKGIPGAKCQPTTDGTAVATGTVPGKRAEGRIGLEAALEKNLGAGSGAAAEAR